MPIDYCFTKKPENKKSYVVCVDKDRKKKTAAGPKERTRAGYLPIFEGVSGGLYAMVDGKKKYLHSMRMNEVKKYGYQKVRIPGTVNVQYRLEPL